MSKPAFPRFPLGPNTSKPSMNGANKDPKAQKEKMNMFKRHLAANRARSDEAIRRKMELLKEQRSLSNLTKSHIQKDMESEAKQRVEEELGRPVSSKEWPFVYFVVTLDQVPQPADDQNSEHTKSSQTARERQRFLTSRRKKIQEAREETERIREANIDMGLRLEPIKPSAQLQEQRQIQRMRTRPSLTKHPTTPASSIGSKADFTFINDDLSDVEMTRRSIGMIINDTLSQVGAGQKPNKQCPVSNLELPEISSGTKRKALGTSVPGSVQPGERKMVTFADGLPVIKGNSIAVVGTKHVDLVSSSPFSQSQTPKSSDAPGVTDKPKEGREDRDGEILRPPWSAPLTARSLNSITPRSRLYAPMALPKIDIVSEIYDELIVKTIQNYLLSEGYSQEKFHQLRQTVLSRLSATYPHLVKHKAWRHGHWAGDEQDSPEADQELTTGDDMDRPRFRARSQQSRLGRSLQERALSSFDFDHNLRPFTCPFLTSQSDGESSSPAFMSIDGRTMPFTPRDENRLRQNHLGATSAAVTPKSPFRSLPGLVEEGKEDREGEGGLGRGEPMKPFVIPAGENE